MKKGCFIDFKNEYMEGTFDYVETIKVSYYKFYKGCLGNKVMEYKKEEQEYLKYEKDMYMNW